MAGLDPQDSIDSAGDFDATSRLVKATAPVLAHMRETLAGMSVGGLLADRSATIVSRYFGDSFLAATTEKIGGQVGVIFDEERTGTNAIATAHETRVPVIVQSSEHYLDCLRGFSCYGVPIINPVSQRLEGVLDIMSDIDGDERWMRAILNRAVHEIRQRLMSDYDPDVLSSLASFNTLTRKTEDPVILFGRDFVLHNRQSVDVLGAVGFGSLDGLAFEFQGASGTVDVELAEGRFYTVDSVPVSGEGCTLLRIRGEQSARTVIPRGASQSLSESAKLDGRIAALVGSSESVLVVGEPGSGRTTAARQVAGAVPVLDGATATAEQIDDAGHADGEGREALIVEHIHLLSPSSAQRLAAVVREQKIRIILTTTPDQAAESSAAYLGSLCPTWLELPTLRERLADLPGIASSMLASTAREGQGELRLSRVVVDQLRAYDWPGNLAELANVLGYVRGQRDEGDVVVADLPERYRSLPQARAGLTPMEQGERDLIVRSLAALAGNKVHTARHLGISRSKLYDRIRYFRLG